MGVITLLIERVPWIGLLTSPLTTKIDHPHLVKARRLAWLMDGGRRRSGRGPQVARAPRGAQYSPRNHPVITQDRVSQTSLAHEPMRWIILRDDRKTKLPGWPVRKVENSRRCQLLCRISLPPESKYSFGAQEEQEELLFPPEPAADEGSSCVPSPVSCAYVSGFDSCSLRHCMNSLSPAFRWLCSLHFNFILVEARPRSHHE